MSKIRIDEYHEKISRLIEQNSLEQAAYHCLYLLRQFPKMSSLYQLLGRIFLETGNYPGALDVYLRLASSGPDIFLYHVTLSFIFEKLKHQPQALFFERIGYYLQPDFSEKQKAFLLQKEKQSDPASASSEMESFFAAGKQHFNEKSYEAALRCFQKAADKNAFIVNDLYLGMTYAKLSIPEKALAVLQKALGRSPYLVTALKWTASYFYQKNELYFSRVLERLIAIDPNYENYSIVDGQIAPGRSDIQINYQDWTGFPNTKLWSGWLRSGDKFIENKIDRLPAWLSLLPVCADFLSYPESKVPASSEPGPFQQNEARNKLPLKDEDRFFQIDYFKSQLLAETAAKNIQTETDKKTVSEKKGASQRSGLDEAFNLLEKVATEGLPPDAALKEETAGQTPAAGTTEKPESDADALEKIRKAWNCFSTGEPAQGIQIYHELLEKNIRTEQIREDIQKLIILFPENQDLQQLID